MPVICFTVIKMRVCIVMKKKNILIVDDDADILSSITRYYLLNYDDVYSLFVSADGTEALELMKAKEIDVIFVDLSMPNLDGLGVCKSIMGYSSLKNINIVIASGTITENDVRQLKDMGVRFFLDKPYCPEDLFALADTLLKDPE